MRTYLDCYPCFLRQALHSTAQLDVVLLGRLPLDLELARHCDTGGIQDCTLNAFAPIVKRIVQVRLR